MAIKFDTLDKNIASAATNVNEEKPPYITKQELNDILYDFKQEIIREIVEPIKNDIDKIAKKVNILSENVNDLKQDVDGLKAKMDEIYEPTKRERKTAAGSRLFDPDYYKELEEEANNAIPEGDEQ